MNKVPPMISTKDLAYLEDMFNWNFNASKKANHYINEIQDEDVKKAATEFRDLHKNICLGIINILS